MTTSTLVPFVEEYLALRRGLGFEMVKEARLLFDFAGFADRVSHRGALSVDLALRWATSSRSKDPSNAARRLSVLRGFAQHRAAFDSATEIPPPGLLGRATPRKSPHIYSDTEITTLLHAALTIRPRGGLRPYTYVTLFALLASTGLRISEACRLERQDVDLSSGILTVRIGKFRKSRLVPLHISALEPLRHYSARRDRCRGVAHSEFFFRTEWAPCLTTAAVEMTFFKLRRRVGWTGEGRARLPRIHDLRHTFAVRRLLRWYEEGLDLDRKLAVLATYLGHAKVSDTYWYLTAVPELMTLTAQRFEHFARREEESAS